MVKEGTFTAERFEVIHEFQKNGDDANQNTQRNMTGMGLLKKRKRRIKGYLGTNNEIGFDEVEEIVKEFKAGTDEIWLKRMGREDTELWYEKVDFSLRSEVLVIEWTHGNSDNYKGVDIPFLLNSTHEETLAHRRARNVDGATDSPFTMMVLELDRRC